VKPRRDRTRHSYQILIPFDELQQYWKVSEHYMGTEQARLVSSRYDRVEPVSRPRCMQKTIVGQMMLFNIANGVVDMRWT
jgi:hypothetical protein